MVFVLGPRSLQNLQGVHPDLVKVVKRALEVSPVDFTVIDGLRTETEEALNIAKGASQTKHSRHLTGHAVDIAAFVHGKVVISWEFQPKIADAMKHASRDLGIPITWGGDWRSFRDGVHFELPWKQYPWPLPQTRSGA